MTDIDWDAISIAVARSAGYYYSRVHGIVDYADLVQEGMAGALHAADVSHDTAYLITAAQHAMIDYLRRELRWRNHAVLVDRDTWTDDNR